MEIQKQRLDKFKELHREVKKYINLNPLQRGGILTKTARKALNEFGDGYAIYDISPGLEILNMPIVKKFIEEILPEFFGADVARITFGAREGIFTVLSSISKPNDILLVDGNVHYTTILAAERAGLNIIKVQNSGPPEYKINVEEYEDFIKKHKSVIVLLTYPDGSYGNLPDAKKLGEIAKRYSVPYLIDGAYAIGRMPIKMNEIGADFIIGSGHKSMASSGPIGVLGMAKKWAPILLRKSKEYPANELNFLGSEVRGTPLVTLMASFPHVVERIKHYDEEVKKARLLSKKLEALGINQLGEKPHNHDLMFFESQKLFEISQTHKRGRFFLYKELKKRGIVGIKPGLTKNFKLSTYNLSDVELNTVVDAFDEIVRNN